MIGIKFNPLKKINEMIKKIKFNHLIALGSIYGGDQIWSPQKHSNDKNFKELVHEWFSIIFRKLLINFASSFIWSSLNNSKDISKYNYFTSFLITTCLYNYFIFFPNNYIYFFLTHQHGYKRKISMSLFMSMIFILIELKFDIDINN